MELVFSHFFPHLKPGLLLSWRLAYWRYFVFSESMEKVSCQNMLLTNIQELLKQSAVIKEEVPFVIEQPTLPCK